MLYIYGMRLRGFSPSCQPMEGLVDHFVDITFKYYDILVYNRKLSEDELDQYELDYIGDMIEEEHGRYERCFQ